MASPVVMAEPEMEMLPCTDVAIDIQAIPGRPRVLSGAKTAARVVFRILTPEAGAASPTRPPVDVACVLDRSGSMGGQSLDYAKRAVKKLVKHLSPSDTLHFITYSENAQVVFRDGDLSESGRENLRAMIDGVWANGRTNLVSGLDLAVETLTGKDQSLLGVGKGKEAMSDGRVRRIFLFSDGKVNVGMTNPHEIRQKVAQWAEAGVTTSSFGIGLQFDETLMRGIAEAGQGRYKFLSTARDIPKLVSKSVHDLLDLYASEVTLDLRGGEHTTVTRVYGGDEEEEDAANGDAPGLLRLGDLHNANERLVLAELEVAPPGNIVEGATFAAAEWTLSGQRGGAPMQFSGQILLQATRDRASLGDEATIVRTSFAIRRAGDQDLEVANLLGRGDRQRAREVKAQQLQLLREALDAAQSSGADTQMLERIIERAQAVADQIDDEREDVERVRRQCVQECEMERCMSCASFNDRANSSASGGDGDVANLRDLDGFEPFRRSHSPPLSPRSWSPSGRSDSPPLSPRSQSPVRRSNSPPLLRRTRSDTSSTCSGDTERLPSRPAAPKTQDRVLVRRDRLGGVREFFSRFFRSSSRQ